MAQALAKELNQAEVQAKFQNQIEIISSPDTFVNNLISLQAKGFDHMVNMLAVDWIADKKFQVTYNLWSYQLKLHIYVKVFVDRDNAKLPTIQDLWPSAQVYEREIHEMFGIFFDGNTDLRPLFLHNWMEIPPLRKDFDTNEYSRQMFSYKGSEKAIIEGGKE